jgi:hypothetical protein
VKEALAEKLLARVLQWGQKEMSEERPSLLDMAAHKYDEYQQFSPGMRFIESLARWLNQFATLEERHAAFAFVKNRLIFCSSAEMAHLVEMAYPDHIRPLLLRRVAEETSGNLRHAAKVAGSVAFRLRQRQCLFLGLSDGARIDVFRRANHPDLSHEQIWQTHELSQARVDELLDKLARDARILQGSETSHPCKFRTVVLLDDFSASGSSYYMPKADGSMGGKIAAFHRGLMNSQDPLAGLVDLADTEVIILLYMATEQARAHLRQHSDCLWVAGGIRCSIEVVQLLPPVIRLAAGDGDPLGPLIDRYYDHSVFDEHMRKGETQDGKYGYAACGLPLVLHHNTPNNSIALLWSYEDREIRGLFPRVKRHKEAP